MLPVCESLPRFSREESDLAGRPFDRPAGASQTAQGVIVNTACTWHYGLMAEWWAEFNTDGPEIDYFGHFVRQGQPALDAGCGTGRLLLPWLRAGYDVDGCDVSPDMVAQC